MQFLSKIRPYILSLTACASANPSYARGGASTGGGAPDIQFEARCELQDEVKVHFFQVFPPPTSKRDKSNSTWFVIDRSGCSEDGLTCPPTQVSKETFGTFNTDRLFRDPFIFYKTEEMEIKISILEAVSVEERAKLKVLSPGSSQMVYPASGVSRFTQGKNLNGFCIFSAGQQ